MQAAVKTLTNEAYHANTESVSNSMVCVMLEDGPRTYQASFVTKTMEWKPPTKEQDRGTVLHTMVLQPDTLDDLVAGIPTDVLTNKGHRRGKAWDQFAAENAGRILLTAREFDEVYGMYKSLADNPITGPLLRVPGETEQSIFWECKTSGLKRKVRPDRHYPGKCLDLKTTKDASVEGFGRLCNQYFYHCQRASYCDGLEVLTGERPEFLLVVVQSSPPYTCCAYNLEERAINIGEMLTRRALGQIAACQDSGDWSEPGEHGIIELSLPNYIYSQYKEDENDG